MMSKNVFLKSFNFVLMKIKMLIKHFSVLFPAHEIDPKMLKV
jgi:hypothetical protein